MRTTPNFCSRALANVGTPSVEKRLGNAQIAVHEANSALLEHEFMREAGATPLTLTAFRSKASSPGRHPGIQRVPSGEFPPATVVGRPE